ncbi:MAG: hypothetical protein L6R38_006765 [Xanthoria sp. 2 TBL-2021]|nr:MAG: hypothetical protein L6R38_006765 [Xanthoria sp. 2 TBL-2021]
MPAPPMPTSLQKSLDETKCEYIQLGSSGLRVSMPILGTMGIGSQEWQDWVMSEEEGLKTLKAAYDRGVTTWDTANVYSSGANEEVVGKAIKEFSIPREKLTILAKVFGTVPEDKGIFNFFFEDQMVKSKDYINRGGLSRGAIMKAVDASLKRLGTDYIDLLQIHRFDPTVPPAETMKALHDLVQMGKVHYIGASSMWTYQFATMQFIAEKNGWTKFISMQNSYHLCYREEEREMNKFCNETGVGIIPWGPLFGGLLAKPWGEESTRSKMSVAMSGGLTEVDEGINKRVQEVARKKGWKMSQVALAWVRGKGCVPIMGLTSANVQRLEEACAIKDMRLTEEETEYLEELYVPKQVAGHV